MFKTMAKFNLVTRSDTDSNELIFFLGNTIGAYQLMSGLLPTLYLLRLKLDRKSGLFTDAAVANIETYSYGLWGHGFMHTPLVKFLQSLHTDMDAELAAYSMDGAPLTNYWTSEVQGALSTPENYNSLLKEVIWRVRCITDQSVGQYEAGIKGAEMDIPVCRGGKLMVSSVAIGRTFGISKSDMDTGALAKFNHRVGKANGPRMPWTGRDVISRDGLEIEPSKIVAWQDRQNSMTVLNKFEISTESMSAIARHIHSRLSNMPMKSLDNAIRASHVSPS